MKQTTLQATGRVRLCFLSHAHLSALATPVFAEYAARADIEVVEASFQPAISAARARERSGNVDAFVSAGSNAALLREAVALPVASIDFNGYDVLLALRQARVQGKHRVGIINFGATVPELDQLRELLNIEVLQRAYRTPQEARDGVAHFGREGCGLVIGPSLAVEAARQQGLAARLAYSEDSVRQAIETGIEMARVARLESARNEQVAAVLHNLEEALLAVDAGHRVVTANSAMQKLLGAPLQALAGRDLREFAPELSLAETLASGQDERGQVLQFAGRDWIASRTPLREAGRTTGAVLALYDARSIEEADASLRSQRRHRRLPSARWRLADLQGSSPAFTQALDAARRFADTELSVLITGESGTGKELFAQAIHNASRRSLGPFVALNCSALPESLLESELFGYEEGAFTGSRRGGKPGLFEAAHRGTVFLDEIGDMPLLLQTRLLRVLQEREVMRLGSTRAVPIDVRVIAATHQPLSELVAERRFRADLYYRLNLLRLRLPALRERDGDLQLLALAALHRRLTQLQSGIDPRQVLARLLPRLSDHDWPGNVRELENVCDRIAVYFAHAGNAQAPLEPLLYDCPELQAQTLVAQDKQSAERDLSHARLVDVLNACAGHRGKAAAQLGISRATLWRRLRGAGLAEDASDRAR